MNHLQGLFPARHIVGVSALPMATPPPTSHPTEQCLHSISTPLQSLFGNEYSLCTLYKQNSPAEAGKSEVLGLILFVGVKNLVMHFMTKKHSVIYYLYSLLTGIQA